MPNETFFLSDAAIKALIECWYIGSAYYLQTAAGQVVLQFGNRDLDAAGLSDYVKGLGA